jgi:hypothetical protein
MEPETALRAPTTTKKLRKRRISPKIVQAIELLAKGECRTQKQAAERVGVSEEWLSTMLGRDETRVLLEQTVRKSLRTGTVRASARLIELLDSNSSRTALEASKHVLAISGHAPPRDGATVNIHGGEGAAGFIIQLVSAGDEVIEGSISSVGGVQYGRKMTPEERRTGQLIPSRPGAMIDVSPNTEAETPSAEPARKSWKNGDE